MNSETKINMWTHVKYLLIIIVLLYILLFGKTPDERKLERVKIEYEIKDIKLKYLQDLKIFKTELELNENLNKLQLMIDSVESDIKTTNE